MVVLFLVTVQPRLPLTRPLQVLRLPLSRLLVRDLYGMSSNSLCISFFFFFVLTMIVASFSLELLVSTTLQRNVLHKVGPRDLIKPHLNLKFTMSYLFRRRNTVLTNGLLVGGSSTRIGPQ